jgi:hypothetical protein
MLLLNIVYKAEVKEIGIFGAAYRKLEIRIVPLQSFYFDLVLLL